MGTVKIECDGMISRLWINDVEQKNLTNIEFKHNVNGYPEVTTTQIPIKDDGKTPDLMICPMHSQCLYPRSDCYHKTPHERDKMCAHRFCNGCPDCIPYVEPKKPKRCGCLKIPWSFIPCPHYHNDYTKPEPECTYEGDCKYCRE